jgi:hypothetical protein
VEIADRQQIGLAGREPILRRRPLTLGAMAIAARVVRDAAVAAILAAFDMIFSQARQVNFSRTVWITFHCRGTTSSVSVIVSPSFASLPPQHGQAVGPGITTRSRGRCAGNGARTGFLRVNGCTVVLPSGAALISSSAALAAASSSCNSSWSSSLRPRSEDCPYCSRRSLAICSL